MYYEEQEEVIEETHEPIVRLITFHLEDETYGVEVCRVREILRLNKNFPVPGSPDFVLGITNIRGNVVTIIDARKRFLLPSVEYSDEARMIVVESGEEMAAIVVDSVSDVIDVPHSLLDMNLNVHINGDSRFINGVVSRENEIIIILNVDTFITEDELDLVSGL